MKRFNSKNDLKNFLDEMYTKYNTKSFIEKDPIQIPHKFNLREDIEISAFLTSVISWGNRKIRRHPNFTCIFISLKTY